MCCATPSGIANIREISEKLRLRLTGEEKEKLKKKYTASTDAYQLYLKGRYGWQKRTEEGLRQSVEFFEQAIEKDPAYALAYAGLADSYAVMPSYSILPPAEGFPKARAAAHKALEIDEGLAPAHATLGLALAEYDFDWAASEAEFKRSIELDPGYATAHHWYALMLAALARFDEAMSQIDRARELDPFSAIIQTNTFRILLYARQLDRAIEVGRKVVESNPGFGVGHNFLGSAYAAKKMTGEAIAEYQKAADLLGQTPMGLHNLGRARALAGRRAEALQVIEEFKALATRRYVTPSYVAMIYNYLGDKSAALDWWEKACEDRGLEVTLLKVDPTQDDLRGDPRYAEILRKVKLAP